MKKESEYAVLDSKIVEAIQAGKSTFTPIVSAVRDLANSLAKKDRWGARYGCRLVDRRLQSLRKKGLIEYRQGKWSARSGQ